ncbi:reverse transcriptase domain-containing protein [Algoriphagus sp.]|uniref:reverse transcriptase domain-containing protein n=1 Tax=Algoriphagus sp. TaxID=1872435 RepID=UPI003F70825B
MEFPRRSFSIEAERAGRSREFITGALKYADDLALQDLPVLFSLVHFSLASQCNYASLLGVIKNPEKYYKNYTFKKRRGGKRLIQAPFENLKKAQKFIHNHILSKLPIHDSCFSFYMGRSIVDNAKVHLGQDYIRTFDIKDFFTSINSKQVYDIFEEIGYVKNLAIDLANICTLDINKNGLRVLPQGSPASPSISNLILKNFDRRMYSYAIKNNIKYSRYADDFTFSGNIDFLPKVSFIQKVLKSEGFNLNHQKTRTYGPKHTKRIITGLMVSDKISIPPKFIHEILQHFYYLRKFGVREHIEFINSKNGFDRNYYYEWISGKLLFLKMVQPEIAIPLLDELSTFDWPFKNVHKI